ncbi:MAG: Ig-like domain-containing protein [Acetivibrio ethanolgignens]
MRLLKKLSFAFTLTLALSIASPSFIPMHVATEAKAATMKINYSKKNLRVGQSCQLKISGTKEKVIWKSDQTKIASVSSKGKVMAKAVGKAKIMAQVKGKSLICEITVTAAENKYVKTAPFTAKEISLEPYTAAMPKNWEIIELNSLHMLVPEGANLNAGTSSISVAITKNAEARQENFDELKKKLSANLTKEYIADLYPDTATISDFVQEEKVINSQKLLVTRYTITLEKDGKKSSLTQSIYDLFSNGYTTEVTITNNGTAVTPDVYRVGEYFISSLIYMG